MSRCGSGKARVAFPAPGAVTLGSGPTRDKATSSQDAQRQQQGQPTAARQAQGVKPSARTAIKVAERWEMPSAQVDGLPLLL
jgi:hypothetical protein